MTCPVDIPFTNKRRQTCNSLTLMELSPPASIHSSLGNRVSNLLSLQSSISPSFSQTLDGQMLKNLPSAARTLPSPIDASSNLVSSPQSAPFRQIGFHALTKEQIQDSCYPSQQKKSRTRCITAPASPSLTSKEKEFLMSQITFGGKFW